MGQIIETVKATYAAGTFFLYHGGPMRSHTIYQVEEKLHEINFSHQNCSGPHLQAELNRVINMGVTEAKIVRIQVDNKYRFVREQ